MQITAGQEEPMEIALIIMAGLAVITFFASGFDFMTKRRNKLDNETKAKVLELEKKVALLESQVEEKNAKIEHLEENVSFVSKLIEKK
ncbi:MAG: hypothetical protein JW969_12325 [Spirochaetales bacterium]|nr:hypothetical protein [Spirochaetales bacterium]